MSAGHNKIRAILKTYVFFLQTFPSQSHMTVFNGCLSSSPSQSHNEACIVSLVLSTSSSPSLYDSASTYMIQLEMVMGKYLSGITTSYPYTRHKNNPIGSPIYTGVYEFTPIPIPVRVWVTHRVTRTVTPTL
jgi:hypothetical protein